jgi:hypothetical protein
MYTWKGGRTLLKKRYVRRRSYIVYMCACVSVRLCADVILIDPRFLPLIAHYPAAKKFPTHSRQESYLYTSSNGGWGAKRRYCTRVTTYTYV